MKNWQAATIAIAWVGILLALPLSSVTYYAIEYSLPMPPIPAPPYPDGPEIPQRVAAVPQEEGYPVGKVYYTPNYSANLTVYDGDGFTFDSNYIYRDGSYPWGLWWGEDTGEK